MAGGDVAPRSNSDSEASGSLDGKTSDTLGGALRRARRERDLTIQQIAATTRIPARHLEALERDDVAAVPGGMYLRAEIRAFADAVGLNRDVALGYLNTPVDPPVVPDLAAQTQAARSSRRAAAWGAAAVAGICLVGAAVMLWPDRERRQAASNATASDTSASSDSRTAPDKPVAASARENGANVRTSDAAPAVTFDAAASAATSGTTESSPIVASGDLATASQQPKAAAADPVLEIVTEPAGARVTIDGVGWGVTPVAIRYLSPGSKQLRVTSDGFATEQRVIRFSADQPRTSVRIELHQAR